MEKIRDIIDRAYAESKVIGVGLQMTSAELKYGLDILNGIFDELYLDNLSTSTAVQTVDMTGRNVTIGTGPNDDGVDPDIVVPIVPERLTNIILTVGTTRYQTKAINADEYYNRSTDYNSNIPTLYYYNPLDTATGFATINWAGAPTGTAEITYNNIIENVDANVDISAIPKSIRPYITHELAYRIADENGLNDVSLSVKRRANAAYRKLLNSLTHETTNNADRSGIRNTCNGRADSEQALREITRGY